MAALTATRHMCPRCEVAQDPEEFFPRKKGQGWVDREAGINRHSYCKTCENKRVGDWKARNPDKQKAYHATHRRRFAEQLKERRQTPEEQAKRKVREARRRRRVRSNAKALAEQREKARLWAWEARRRAGAEEIPNGGLKAPDRERAQRVSSGPFGEWLTGKLEEYGAEGLFERRIAISVRAAKKYMDGSQPTVSIDVVDRSLIHEGTTFLWQLYPDLYPGLDVPALKEILADVCVPATRYDGTLYGDAVVA